MTRILGTYLIVAITLAIAPGVAGQSLLFDVRVLNSNIFLDIVPAHGKGVVAYRDFRDGAYGIFVTDVESGAEHRIATVPYAEPGVATFDVRVAWIGYTSAGQPDVFVHDRATGGGGRLTTDTAFQNHPHLSRDRLVWQDYRHGGTGATVADIYLHDFTSGETRRITTGSAYRDLPRIHANRIVWQDYRHSGPELTTAEIYLYDLLAGVERRLTTGNTYRTHPEIFGDLVVWEDYRNGDRGDIYLYDLSRDEEVPVSVFPAHKTQPSVHGDWIVWLDYRAGTGAGDLYGYNLKTRDEYALLVHPAHQEPPHVFGQRVVWQDFRNSRSNLMIGMLSDPSDTAVELPDVPAAASLTALPNPSMGDVTISMTGPSYQTTPVTIYDTIGRIIWRAEVPPGQPSIIWNGLDRSGRRVPPSVYVAVTDGTARVSTIIVRL